MLNHEYGGPPFFFLEKGEDVHPYVAAHLKVLFLNAVKASRRSPRGKRVFGDLVSRLPRPTKLRLVDERNSIALALNHEDLTRLTRLDRRLGQIVDAIAKETAFGFSDEEIAHVYAADSMAAVALATSRSGYVRELGLSRIDRIGTEVGFALVVLRLNDWVPEVRAAAVKAIERTVKHIDEPLGGPAFSIAAAAGQLLDDERFRRTTRKDRDFALSLLEHPRVKESLRWLLLNRTADRTAARNLRAMIRNGYFDDLLPEIATEAKCSHLRLIAVRALLDGRYVWKHGKEVRERKLTLDAHRATVMKSALGDSSANVVFAALGNLVETKELRRLDNLTVDQLKTRQEISLQRRIASMLRLINEEQSG